MNFRLLLLILLMAFVETASASSQWFYTRNSDRQGQAMVIHGLNTKPMRMNSIIRELRDNGYDVLRVTLQGHDDSLQRMRTANRQAWLSNITSAYSRLIQRKRRFGGETVGVGYSLGGLVTVNYLLSFRRHQIDRLVLFAPALSVHYSTYMVQASYAMGDEFIVPSMSPASYRVHRGVSVNAYRGLFSLIEDMDSSRVWSRVNIPTKVFIDSEDEVVSKSGLEVLISDHSLSNWELVELNLSRRTATHGYNHIIINPASVGRTEWNRRVSPALR